MAKERGQSARRTAHTPESLRPDLQPAKEVPGAEQRNCQPDGAPIVSVVALLYSYLHKYRALILLALVLAATNQVFSLLDPLIFRHVIDDYATRFREYQTSTFIKGAGTLLLMAMGVAFVSRVAKNFQDYYVNNIVHRVGAAMSSEGIRHSLELP